MKWSASGQEFIKIHKPEKADDWSGIVWYNGVTEIPSDYPTCGRQGEICQQEKTDNKLTLVLLPIIFGGLALLVIIVAVFLGKKYRYQAILKELEQIKVSWNDVLLINNAADSSAHIVSNTVPSQQTDHNECLKLALYKDTNVVIHYLKCNTLNIRDNKVQADLKIMQELDHSNISPFMGICTEAPNICYLMIYGSRGNLQDIISNDNINIFFKISFILDIACGMWYLHQSVIQVHGHLTSAKCVVDNRWTCKITGHGLKYIKQLYHQDQHNVQANYNRLIWTAPEILQNETDDIHVSNKFRKGDVFSFSIIAQEVFLNDVPYAANSPELQPADIIQKVKNRECPPYRPVIPTDACNENWRKLIQSCWSEDPEQRPTFEQILYSINSIHRYKNMDLVDNMIKRLEQYTCTLEERVIKRSIELQGEKDKVEILLMELLPRSVAQQLALGHQVSPEAFDNVTIFMSDIVGFTRISSRSTPLQVVDMLNSMYTMFDDLANHYDVYKVATIGDAYMVASGVPIRNGDQHAKEICAMSLMLLNALQDLPIAHLPGQHLSMRIGIFSGPCVAAVAGIKMPRYLLFGDTVDIAAKMESSGEAMKVQIGHSTQELIKTDPHFHSELRGEIELKSKLKLKTYWLEGVKLNLN